MEGYNFAILFRQHRVYLILAVCLQYIFYLLTNNCCSSLRKLKGVDSSKTWNNKKIDEIEKIDRWDRKMRYWPGFGPFHQWNMKGFLLLSLFSRFFSCTYLDNAMTWWMALTKWKTVLHGVISLAIALQAEKTAGMQACTKPSVGDWRLVTGYWYACKASKISFMYL